MLKQIQCVKDFCQAWSLFQDWGPFAKRFKKNVCQGFFLVLLKVNDGGYPMGHFMNMYNNVNKMLCPM